MRSGRVAVGPGPSVGKLPKNKQHLNRASTHEARLLRRLRRLLNLLMPSHAFFLLLQLPVALGHVSLQLVTQKKANNGTWALSTGPH